MIMAGATGLAAAATKAVGAAGPAKTYVLVHGAWHGGWCWRDVARALRAEGHTVFVPTLTGMGERSHTMSRDVNLTTHITDVANLITWEELENVILVGHSYAGHILPGVADRVKSKLRHMVYVDANMGRDGYAFLTADVIAGRAKTAIDGYLLAAPAPNPTLFGVPPDHPGFDWVKRRLTLHSLNCLAEVVHLPNGGDAGIPKTFIRCTKGRDPNAPDPAAAIAKDKPEWKWITMDTGHDVMVTMPDELAKILIAAG